MDHDWPSRRRQRSRARGPAAMRLYHPLSMSSSQWAIPFVVDYTLCAVCASLVARKATVADRDRAHYALTGPQLRSNEIPFVCDQCRKQVEQEMSTRPGHTALAISLSGGYWTTWGRGSAEEARTRALGPCLGASQSMCFVYAVDGKVVWKEAPLDVPPVPWFSHTGEKPLAVNEPGIFSDTARKFIDKFYSPASGSKAIAMGEGGYVGYAFGAQLKSEDEAARVALERCAFLVQATCRIIAINDSLVVDADAIIRLRRSMPQIGAPCHLDQPAERVAPRRGTLR